LLFEHGAPAIASILGVLKAGRAYVPLDIHQPDERLRRILEDSGANTIVTNDRKVALAQEISNPTTRLIAVDKFRGERADNPGITVAPTDLATILFTSGSTGVPKGVVHNQRNILHNASDLTNCLHLAESDRLIQLFSYDTGASIPQIYGSLLNGASLHLFDLRARGFVDLANYLAEEKITIYYSVLQVFRHLIAALSPNASFPDLRLIRIGGEAPRIGDVELYRKHFAKSAMLQISLASTEISPIRGLFIDSDTRLDGPLVPAGYEMPDIEVSILDDNGNEVVAGQAGQIAIRSEFLFCEYWKNPSLTAAVMTTGADNRRTFRTGDRGMLIDDGCLVHLGRRESMVKIGGMSVEVAEVEAALLMDGDVREVAVIGRPDRSGDTRLIAYVVGSTPTTELRVRAARTLPSWMIPAVFVPMEALPLNRNGKIDRAALPDPTPARYGENPPRDPLEMSLVAVWEELLRIRPVGIRDDFFQLGGDSLLAVELVTQIEAIVHRHVPVELLVENPTIEQQAEVLRSGDWSLQWPAVVPLQLHGDRPPIFLVPAAATDVTALIGFARGIGNEQPFYGLQPPGLDGLRPPPSSIEEQAAYFVAELRRTHPKGPYFLGGTSFGGVVAFEMAQQLTRMGEQVAFVGLLDTHAAQFPRMRWRVPIRFWIFRLLGNTMYQSPERTVKDIALEIIGIWQARLTNRIRKLRRRPLTRMGSYFDSFDKALLARRRYRISPYPGKITLFRYAERPSPMLYHSDPLMGWSAVGESLEIVDVPGTHSNLTPDDFQSVCDRLREHLHAAQDAVGREDTPAAS
jgi:acyl-coenzyme A synthetase/AMP-(fatty) acid ligase/thioesterase domain-containing protein